MVEPSQIIAQKYFEMVEGYFLRANVKYAVPRNYSDIDLIGVNSSGNGLVVEVKSWGQENIGIKKGKVFIDKLSSDKLLSQQIEKILGERKPRKVLVLAHVGKRSDNDLRGYAKARDIEILTIDCMLKKLIERLDEKPSYDTETLQVLRMLKVYKKRGKIRLSFLARCPETQHSVAA